MWYSNEMTGDSNVRVGERKGITGLLGAEIGCGPGAQGTVPEQNLAANGWVRFRFGKTAVGREDNEEKSAEGSPGTVFASVRIQFLEFSVAGKTVEVAGRNISEANIHPQKNYWELRSFAS